MRWKTGKTLIFWTALLMVAMPVLAQDGQGLITTAEHIEWLIQKFSPLHCTLRACEYWVDLLYPPLISTDPDTGLPLPGDGALATGWEALPDGQTFTLHLREELFWQDGTPVTAYDALYMLAALSEVGTDSIYWDQMGGDLLAAAPLDDYTLTVIFAEDAGCAGLDRLRVPVVPAHVLEADFAQEAAPFFPAGTDPVAAYESWLEARGPRSFAYVRNMQRYEDFAPLLAATAHDFQFVAYQPDDHIDLLARDGDLAVRILNMSSVDERLALFLRGKLNFLPFATYINHMRMYDGWGSVYATPGVQTYTIPGPYRLALVFNSADPDHPQPAFDEDGQPLDQGHHPIFGDVRVRQAVALALNAAALNDVDAQGYAFLASGLIHPSSWAAEGEQPFPVYDPMAAVALLEAAGWIDVNHDGVRECVGCLYGQEGDMLWFRLSAFDDVAAEVVANQLERVGFSVNVQTVSDLTPGDAQRFDANLHVISYGFTDPDPGRRFSAAGDVPDDGPNNGSYHNAALDNLLEQARHVPGCAVDTRAELYRAAESILAEDVPVVWLYAYPEMIAVQGGVHGFAPRPFAPLWNMADWVVVR